MSVQPVLPGNGVSSKGSGGVVASSPKKIGGGVQPSSGAGGLAYPSTGSTAPSTTPTNVADIDKLRLAGKLLPGVWTIKPSDVGPKLAKRGADAKGRTGNKVDVDGLKLMQFAITGRFWLIDDVDTVKALIVPMVRPSNPKSVAPVTIDSWITRIYAIQSVLLEDAPGPMHEGRGVYTWEIKASEWRPPTVAAGGGSGGAGTVGLGALNANQRSLLENMAALANVSNAVAQRAAGVAAQNAYIQKIRESNGSGLGLDALSNAGALPPSSVWNAP